MKLDKETRRKLKLFETAKKVQRKLASRGGTPEQRKSWKQIMAKAYKTFPTDEEQKMLPHMQAIGFEPQVLICGYIADFASDRHHAIVEIDGPIHSGQKQYDQMRDRCLYDHGWRILRFTNEQVNRSPKAVADEVLKSL
jgi:very-short-patch-repair endonuclease